ncbi:hypothetical protein TNCV_2729771 [Trichonephila clavipes]|nr:hypothetical protein TNCV_2729771 [Trichonephila clavipes]
MTDLVNLCHDRVKRKTPKLTPILLNFKPISTQGFRTTTELTYASVPNTTGRLADIKAKRNRPLKDGSGRCIGHAMLSPLNSFRKA